MTNDPNQFTHDAWEANADVWDSRMGDDGNDFFNTKSAPTVVHYLLMAKGSLNNHASR